MRTFFEDIHAIDQFTLSLGLHQAELQCVHCSKSDQFVSHGFIYKQRSQTLKEPVGKRIFCSNRHGRSGCGRTFQLYIAREMPSLHYGCAQLFVFVSSLFLNLSVVKAYQQATAQSNTRNAWRWLKQLDRRLIDYREFLKVNVDNVMASFPTRTKPLQILLPTLQRLFDTLGANPCPNYQLHRQMPFL